MEGRGGGPEGAGLEGRGGGAPRGEAGPREGEDDMPGERGGRPAGMGLGPPAAEALGR